MNNTPEVTIDNFAGVSSASIQIKAGKTTLIAGRNGAGKSSALAALAALLSVNALPIRHADGKQAYTKKDAGKLVNDDADQGEASIFGSDWSTSIRWPSCKITREGETPLISDLSAGMVNWMFLPTVLRVKMLAGVLEVAGIGFAPTLDDLASFMVSDEFEVISDKKTVGALLDQVKTIGWDDSAKQHADLAREAKGVWRHVAGEAWGSAKANVWRPEGLTLATIRKGLAFLGGSLGEVKKAYDVGINSRAMDATELSILQHEASKPDQDVDALSSEKEAANLLLEDTLKDIADEEGRLMPVASDSEVQEWRLAAKSSVLDVEDIRVQVEVKESEAETLKVEASELKKLTPKRPESVNLTNANAWDNHHGSEVLCSEWGDAKSSGKHYDYIIISPTTHTAEEVSKGEAEQEKYLSDKSEFTSKLDGLLRSVERQVENIAILNQRAEGAERAQISKDSAIANLEDFDCAVEHNAGPADNLEGYNSDKEALEKRIWDADVAIEAAKIHNNGILSAQEELEGLDLSAQTTQEDIDKLEVSMDEIQHSISLLKKHDDAEIQTRLVRHHTRLKEILGPQGIRLSKMAEALGSVNSIMLKFCNAAGWKVVEIDKDMNLSYGGRHHLISGAEKFRCQIAIQLAMATLGGDKFVLIDSAETLRNKDALDGLFVSLTEFDGAAVVAMALDKPGDFNGHYDVDSFYWVDDGVVDLCDGR